MTRDSFPLPEYFSDPEEQVRVDAMLMNEELSRVEARGEAKGMLKKKF